MMEFEEPDRPAGQDVVENWDDDDDLQCGNDFNLRHASTTTVGSGNLRRDSVSSRMSTRSDREHDEDWQLTLPMEPERSANWDAISSAESAGIPIPRNVPASALLGGTIKRLGGRRLKKALGDDWGDDLEMPKKLELAPQAPSEAFPTAIRTFSDELASPKGASNLDANADFLHQLAAATQSGSEASSLDKFMDNDDDVGFDTIKMAKSRPLQSAFALPASDFESDFDFVDAPLRLALPKPAPRTPVNDESDLEWAEGSLGTRFGGTRREQRSNPASSITFSPSASSCLTAESEDDDGLDGLVLPDANFGFREALRKRMSSDSVSPKHVFPEPDDFFSGINVQDGDVFDSAKLTLNRNIKVKAPPQPRSPTRRPATTLTFTSRSSESKIPRPEQKPRPALESVAETGPAPNYRRMAPSTPNRRSSRESLLKTKRSMPVMLRPQASPARSTRCESSLSIARRAAAPERCDSSLSMARKGAVPFLPAGSGSSQSHHVSIKYQRPSSSDSAEPSSIVNRPLTRLSHPFRPSTPTNRKDHAPESLTREAAAKKTLTKPMRRRVFGDGNELEVFDDLPTSAATESKYIKQPIARGAPKSLQMRNRLGLHHKSSSSSLNDPPSPTKPHFARDTSASRLAREQRTAPLARTGSNLATVRETGGPLTALSTNWKGSVKRKPKAPPQKPKLIKPMGNLHQQPKVEKGMHWNPQLFRWEGNENILAPFDIPTPTTLGGVPSPQSPRGKAAPALIANIGAAKGVQMSGGMVFDPHRMCWLKAAPAVQARHGSNPVSQASTDDDDEDPFAGLEDLEDKPTDEKKKRISDEMEPLVLGEEFDVGPEFVRRLRSEEQRWRSKVGPWIRSPDQRNAGFRAWRWAIREKARGMA